MARLTSDEVQRTVDALRVEAARHVETVSGRGLRHTAAGVELEALALRFVRARRVELVGGPREPPLAITPGRELVCQMTNACAGAVTHIDDKGFVYCTAHATVRRGVRRCRLLRASERAALERGEALPGYGGSR